MNRIVQMVSIKSVIPALALAAALIAIGPTAAFAQRAGGGHGGHPGGGYSSHSFAGGGHGHSAPSYAGHGYAGGRTYAAPSYAGRSYIGGRSYYGGSYSPGRFYAGHGYYWGGRFWARPYFGVGIGIPYGSGYYSSPGCGYYDGFGNWVPAPCYTSPYYGY